MPSVQMKKPELRYYPDPVLRRVSQPIAQVDDTWREIADQMFEIMYASRGVGLAGAQVGLSWRIVVGNCSGEAQEKDQQAIFINPKIVDSRGSIRSEEGCLSLPGITSKVLRSEWVAVEYMDLDGVRRKVEGTALLARMIQHEIDHLDGVMIIDKMSPAERSYWAPTLKEFEEEFRAKRKPRARPTPASAL